MYSVQSGVTRLMQVEAPDWAEAVSTHGAEGLYTRLNITAAVRKREHLELLETLDPPMNADEPRAGSRSREVAGDEDGAAASGF